MNEAILRRLGPEDAQAIHELIAASSLAMLERDGMPQDEQAAWLLDRYSPETLRERLENNTHVMLGLEQAETLISVAALRLADGTASLSMGYVHPDHQGQGHGRTLFDARIQAGLNEGATLFTVTCAPTNAAIRRLAEQHGFRITSLKGGDDHTANWLVHEMTPGAP